MKPRAASICRRLALAVLGAGLCGGCSGVPWHKIPLDASTGFYDSASFTYRLDAGKLQQPLEVVRVEGQTVTYDQVASSPLPEQSIGTLSLAYPHPAGRAGFAQVKFPLASAAGRASQSPPWWNLLPGKPADSQTSVGPVGSQPEIHEAWVLDIPRLESDHYFKLLSGEGFFNTQRPGDVGVKLTVRINGKELSKNWDQIAELNVLAQRVRREGQLLAFTRPSALAIERGQIHSTRWWPKGAGPTDCRSPARWPAPFR